MRNAECGIKSALFHTPLGWAGVSASDKGITRIVLPMKGKKDVKLELMSSECRASGSETKAVRLLDNALVALTKYFSGERVLFDLPLDLGYYTPFQQAVWRAVMKIPSGETRSYAWVARRIKKPLAARAVGQAVGANPIPIIIP